jgi:hypothetical protein
MSLGSKLFCDLFEIKGLPSEFKIKIDEKANIFMKARIFV